ncbi:TetR/AcrR family transcriptional regulator [Stackebrandtia nassauensis]|uniref:Transcriptional regulator, TetR family n=1 Tax=Stackebrandtia nassauensis (strain DSM 44728 / CIP 108903 / NRRL B-16338 / NBRC 102104 / LLR-40K-21) TaxID=446470 RepID=D3PZN3_STANL|nr:TetR/AcrR family transcriptional regulator [Stackebrandtia nassauensis]ADD43570.1 transcriptional regulator, TetR family [Stackebrandtia nassauensis DSM 44728]
MSTRDKILDAAAEVIAERGLARATTKAIAAAAGYSEATLYKHFDSKTELFTAVLVERSPGDLSGALARLRRPESLDDHAAALTDVAAAAVDFYRQGFPMAASLFAEPELLRAHRADLERLGGGPHLAVAAVAAFLDECRARGEVAHGINVDAAAALLMGACFQRAFLSHFNGPDDDAGTTRAFAASITATLIAGMRRN